MEISSSERSCEDNSLSLELIRADILRRMQSNAVPLSGRGGTDSLLEVEWSGFEDGDVTI